MNRKQIETEYRVKDGVIVSPGKFEGEPVYVPFFWDAYLNGMADGDDGDTILFFVDAQDIAEFPELANVRQVAIWETEQGFVGHHSK